MVTRLVGNDPIKASDWIGLALKHIIQFRTIFRVADRRDRGQKRCLTVAMVACVPACKLRTFSCLIMRFVNSWSRGSNMGCRASGCKSEFFNLPSTRISPSLSMKGDRGSSLLELLIGLFLLNELYSLGNVLFYTTLHATSSARDISLWVTNFVDVVSRCNLRTRRQCAMMRHTLFKLECFFSRSSTIEWFDTTTAADISCASGISPPRRVMLLLDQWCLSNCKNGGPCHHEFASNSCRGWSPRDSTSAGLSADAVCRQYFIAVNRCISAIRLTTNIFHLLEVEVIQLSIMVESDQRKISIWDKSSDARTFSNNRANNNAADNSNLGNETALRGATRDLEHNNSVRYWFSPSFVRMYKQAP